MSVEEQKAYEFLARLLPGQKVRVDGTVMPVVRPLTGFGHLSKASVYFSLSERAVTRVTSL